MFLRRYFLVSLAIVMVSPRALWVLFFNVLHLLVFLMHLRLISGMDRLTNCINPLSIAFIGRLTPFLMGGGGLCLLIAFSVD